MQAEHYHILSKTFGYSEFRGNQKEIIEHLIAGNDAFVLMPTGAGKSLCFQIPAMVRPGVGIVVSPLIALMQDQVETLNALGVKAKALNSAYSYAENRQTMAMLANNELDLLYIAPERATSEAFLNLLATIKVSIFAIDEAHCVSQWGHDFRPEYTSLNLLYEKFKDVPRIALTATADHATRKDIEQKLELQSAKKFISSFDRPNIFYKVTLKADSKYKNNLLKFIRTNHPNDSGIVYCLSKKKVDAITDFLKENGMNALPYHAGLSNEVRAKNQRKFILEENIIIVATVAFGMGIDKPNVRFVAHLDLPKNIEAYYQETGRAGRDGAPANTWLAYGLQDLVLQKQLIEAGGADDKQKFIEIHKLNSLLGFCETSSCRRQVLLGYFGESSNECGNCDNCQTPVAKFDATIAAQKLISCIYRTKQLYGTNYIVDILLGSKAEKILWNNHHELSTYGIGKEYIRTQWYSIIRQLITLNFLTVDVAGHGSIKITERGFAFLKNKETLTLRSEIEKQETTKTSQVKKYSGMIALSKEDEPLFNFLKQMRFKIAEEQKVPPYVVFADSSLIEIATKKPRTLEDMHQISGVGDFKLNKYGQKFIDFINEFELNSAEVTC